MLVIHYFASLREQLEIETEELPVPSENYTVADLVCELVASDPERRSIMRDSAQVLVAVNQLIVGRDAALKDGDEVAFFPPMTGG